MSVPAAPRVLITTDAVGGVWVYASTLAAALARQGCPILLVSMGPAPRRDQLKALAGIERLQVEVTDLSLEWMDPLGADLERAQDELAALARSFRPDLVHLNGYREALCEWGAPALVAAHSCVRSWWLACHGSEPNEPRWQTYIRNVGAGLAAADCWVAPTAAFCDTIAALYAPPRPGIVIRNGIEPVARDESKEPFILAAGRLWDSAKNVGILGSVAAGLPWPVKVAGSLRSGDNAAAVAETVTALGDLSRHELLRVMQRAEIFVAPALYEPFGLTVLEAADAGCALVLSDIPSFRELWEGAAMFADPRNPGELGLALMQVTKDADLRRTLQRAAQERARRYGLDATVREYRAVYDRMLMSRVAAPSLAPDDTSLIEVRP